ncbi:MAG: molybdenum cofactor guanylyltransferase [Planctomycetota bacterium]
MEKKSCISHLYILAGGRSRRFGSDKALAETDGVPMLRSIMNGLGSIDQHITLVTGETKRYQEFSVRVITDKPSGVGPIGGLNAALSDRKAHCGEGWLMLVACDLIKPHRDWTTPLITQIRSTTAPAIAYRGDQWEPMLALYHTRLLPTIDQMLQRQQCAMHRLLEQVGAQAVELPDGQTSIPQANTPAEFMAARKLGIA